MAIKTYKKGDSTKLSANFRAREFDCPGVGCCSKTPIDEKLVGYLQKIRDHFGKPIAILAYRCPAHNAKTPNASPNSKHCKGMAADFHIDGVKPAEIAKYAESIGVKGIGLYEEKDGNFVHIDTRTSKSFWYGHAQERRTTFGGSLYTMEFTVLRRGDKGDNVKALQILLKGRGYKTLRITGNFGSGTENVLNRFKKSRGLTPDGIVDADTMAALMGV